MQKRFAGVRYEYMLKRLPRNLVVIDGQCLMCQAGAQYVLERNFNFFSPVTYVTEADKAEARGAYKLDKHELHFSSLHSLEFEDIKRAFFAPAAATTTAAAGRASSSSSPGSGRGDTDRIVASKDLALVLIEKVPSRTASFLHTLGRSPKGSLSDEALFTPTALKESQQQVRRKRSGAAEHVDSAQLAEAQSVDLLVSTDFVAVCRVGMHLDRWLVASFFYLVYYLVPARLGTWWFERYINVRRRQIWGTSEKDAVTQLGGAIEGMKERRWGWRTKFTTT